MLTGGRVRMMTTGAAPISPEIKMFFRAVFGCLLLEGYGQTESGSLTSITAPQDLSDGHVGCITTSVQVKLIDVPDLEYFADKGKGEICVKGPGVFKGYYKDPEKTAEVLDKDGYLHSGDIGLFLECGQLKIIDRVKHIFKLSQGEYVAPDKIENDYITTEGVAQIYVHGESLEDCCVGIVVPDEEWLLKYATRQGWEGDFKTLCGNQEVKEMMFARLKKTATFSKLKGFEQVKIIKLHPELFSVENNLLTPTFKSKRPVLKKHFQEDIVAMYAELSKTRRTTTAKKAADEAKTAAGEADNSNGAADPAVRVDPKKPEPEPNANVATEMDAEAKPEEKPEETPAAKEDEPAATGEGQEADATSDEKADSEAVDKSAEKE